MNTPEVVWGRGPSSVLDYLNAAREISKSLREQEEQILAVTACLFSAWRFNRPVFVVGNGGSAGTASHFAADLSKTIIGGPEERGLRALSLDNIPLASAIINDWGKEVLYETLVRQHWQAESVLIAFSVHGGSGQDKAGVWSQNLLKAIQWVNKEGGTTVGFSGFYGGAMKDLCDICVIVPADSTPLVESFHVVLSHLITFELKAMIADRLISQGG